MNRDDHLIFEAYQGEPYKIGQCVIITSNIGGHRRFNNYVGKLYNIIEIGSDGHGGFEYRLNIPNDDRHSWWGSNEIQLINADNVDKTDIDNTNKMLDI